MGAHRASGSGPQVLLATGNAGKVREMRAALAGTGVRLLGLGDLAGPLPEEPEETGEGFLANAGIKALHYQATTGLPRSRKTPVLRWMPWMADRASVPPAGWGTKPRTARRIDTFSSCWTRSPQEGAVPDTDRPWRSRWRVASSSARRARWKDRSPPPRAEAEVSVTTRCSLCRITERRWRNSALERKSGSVTAGGRSAPCVDSWRRRSNRQNL